MAAPLFDRAALGRSGFLDTALARALAADPVGLIDVGARWGVDGLFRPAPELFHAVALEPDRDEASRVAAREADTAWSTIEVVAEAVGARAGPATLHLLARANNSSLYPVDPYMARRYSLLGFEPVRDVPLDLVTLDSLVFERGIGGAQAGEVVKLDVQGAERDVIAGAQRTLAERTVCAVCEVGFFAPYRGIALFSEVELALRDLGLAFYGFLDFQHRSTRRLDKRRARGRERMMQADAVFFRDPMAEGAAPEDRARAVVFLMALLLGYYDYGLEVAAAYGEGEREALTATIEALARIDAAADAATLAQLTAARDDPEALHLALSRLVDARRDLATVHDVSKDSA